jgi:hypothetical protein
MNADFIGFTHAICEYYFEGNWDLEYCDFVDLGVKFGVLRAEPYDPDKHGEQDDVEPGDEWYVWT